MDIKNVENGARTQNLRIFKVCTRICEADSEVADVAKSQPSLAEHGLASDEGQAAWPLHPASEIGTPSVASLFILPSPSANQLYASWLPYPMNTRHRVSLLPT